MANKHLPQIPLHLQSLAVMLHLQSLHLQSCYTELHPNEWRMELRGLVNAHHTASRSPCK